jgi:hypothetical protein
MKNKGITGLAIFLFFTIILTNSASASFFDSFEEMYMTSGYGATNERTEFDWTDTPWLYLKLPDSGFNLITTLWKSPDKDNYVIRSKGYENEIWLSPGNLWDEIKEEGTWKIKAHFTSPFSSPHSGHETAGFTVASAIVPEPVSSILFIAGGAVLACRRYLKKR